MGSFFSAFVRDYEITDLRNCTWPFELRTKN